MEQHTFFYLDECYFEIKYADDPLTEIHILYHPLYGLAQDDIMGMLCKDFQNAFLIFEINNN